MNMLKALFQLLLVFCIQASSANDWPKFDLTRTDQLKALNAQAIDISHDPVYSSAKKYQAYALADILSQLSITGDQDAADWVIVFTARDGYKVAMSYKDALSEPGFIAFKDLAAGSDNWQPFQFGKKTITPEPYYLVWPKAGLDKWQYPWPFQLTSIALEPASSYYGKAAPANIKNADVKKGFVLFSRYCIRCHSVNLAGGSVGPELNIPKNISEYFQENELSGFIRNASTYRAGTQMPSFENLLSVHDTQLIIDYLKQKKLEKDP
ncbi:MAG: cytochrome c [Methylococcales bacterium]|nr:cytochrome c [Methylococcaceae bacterium]